MELIRLLLVATADSPHADWWSTNWFSLVQTIVIGAGLLVAAAALWTDVRARRMGLEAQRAETLMQMTQSHRDIWGRLLDDPELERVLDPRADIAIQPVSTKERMFCTFLILHLYASFEARNAGVFRPRWPEARDLGEFYTLPIPGAVWDAIKAYQNEEFVMFVEETRRLWGQSEDSDKQSEPLCD